MKRTVLIAALLTTTAATVVAQNAQTRRLEVTGAPRGDLRNGPLTYTGSPVNAKVSTLTIRASQAVVTAPAGTPIMQAEGKKTGTFTGTVQVNRGRLSAKGEKLTYSEASGQGVLSGTPSASFAPQRKEDGDTVTIKAAQMSLDVDNNLSTSTGNVALTNGIQSGRAEKLIFDEDRELAQLTGTPSLTRAARGSQKELVITGQEVRALTKNKTLYVRGGVKLVQGTTTTTGDAVYYDDRKNVAYVVGNAVSTDSKSGAKIVAPASGYIEQNTALGRVLRKNAAYKIPTEQFKLRGEK